jgi:hypothetical protein
MLKHLGPPASSTLWSGRAVSGAVGLGRGGGDSTCVEAHGHVPGGGTCRWDVRARGPPLVGHIQSLTGVSRLCLSGDGR